MIKQFIIISLIAIAYAIPVTKRNENLDSQWNMFVTTFNKIYESEYHAAMRRLVWEENILKIQKHNLEYDIGKHTFTMGMNQYGDLTLTEYRKNFLGVKKRVQNNSTIYMPSLNVNKLPTTVDWRNKGFVTPVKNQGQCGSCWAFSTTGSLEGQYFRKMGKLVSLSEQQLVDCSSDFFNDGCNGGDKYMAFTYIEEFGIESENDYRYTAKDGKCQYTSSKIVTKVNDIVVIKTDNEIDLQNAAATVGPISVSIDASKKSFQFYSQGVYNEQNCSTIYLDHDVLVVGYGTENNQDYWLVKNSWGPTWGMSGYIKMSRNNQNQCGIATQAMYPLL